MACRRFEPAGQSSSEEAKIPVSPDPQSLAFMAVDEFDGEPLGRSENSDEHEPNERSHSNQEFNNVSKRRPEQQQGHFGPQQEEPSLDESRLCLIDTACTACMHSREWRLAYQQSLPDGETCSPTASKKMFHFANGQSTGEKVTVWRIPIFFKGYKGEVFSAEIPSGKAPLLLSISAMTALDMVVMMKERKVQIKQLQIEVPLVTSTNHLGIDIAYDQAAGISTGPISELGEPRCSSEREDLLVYLAEEGSFSLLEGVPEIPCPEYAGHGKRRCAPVSTRGVRRSDKVFQFSERRLKELAKTAKDLRVQDRRLWAALKREYTMAEQLATRNFTQTVVFEPFAGRFLVTRIAASEFGWTNSQPMDILDGYDLLSQAGEAILWSVLTQHQPYLVVIAFDCKIWSLLTNMNPEVDWQQLRQVFGRKTLKLIKKIAKYQHSHNRNYLIENPAGSLAWLFEGILAALIEEADAKYAIGDQCAFGKKDPVSGKSVKKPTGWLSNNQHVLNKICRRCQCLWGTHQPVLGSNSFGQRSKQAAAYPPALCRAICRGILDSMISDYVAHMSNFCDRAFAAENLDSDQETEIMPFSDDDAQSSIVPSPSIAGDKGEVDEMKADFWKVEEDQLIRVHIVPRVQLFIPLATDETLPVDFCRISTERFPPSTELMGQSSDMRMTGQTEEKRSPAQNGPVKLGSSCFQRLKPLQEKAKGKSEERKQRMVEF